MLLFSVKKVLKVTNDSVIYDIKYLEEDTPINQLVWCSRARERLKAHMEEYKGKIRAKIRLKIDGSPCDDLEDMQYHVILELSVYRGDYKAFYNIADNIEEILIDV